ncbi:MAG: phosphonate ABC transporter ATP-binding protein [Burkholderiaceae bacterium]
MSVDITVAGLSKTFGRTQALGNVSLRIAAGEMVALLGASGSGKSTLLRHLNGLSAADAGSGRVVIGGRTIQDKGRIAAGIRTMRADIATIFQQFNLVERLPVMTNVLAGALHRQPLWRTLSGRFPADEIGRAWQALERVGIADRAWQRASTLSGGQQQRAAISRAIVQGARLILADEPIASLDPNSAQQVMGLLAELNEQLGITVVVSLHQVPFARRFCPRVIALRNGQVVFDGPSRELDRARLHALYGADVATAWEEEPPAAVAEPGESSRRVLNTRAA